MKLTACKWPCIMPYIWNMNMRQVHRARCRHVPLLTQFSRCITMERTPPKKKPRPEYINCNPPCYCLRFAPATFPTTNPRTLAIYLFLLFVSAIIWTVFFPTSSSFSVCSACGIVCFKGVFGLGEEKKKKKICGSTLRMRIWHLYVR